MWKSLSIDVCLLKRIIKCGIMTSVKADHGIQIGGLSMFYYTEHLSPIGKLTLASDGENLVGLWIEGQKYFLATLSESPVRNDSLKIFTQTKRWIDRYFAGAKPQPYELPLAPAGSGFRQLVWKYMCEIPYGETTTYGEIAKKIAPVTGRRMSAQAVGGAIAHNPILIVMPCHRVIGSDGSLTGYAGGIDRKIQLLTLEGSL